MSAVEVVSESRPHVDRRRWSVSPRLVTVVGAGVSMLLVAVGWALAAARHPEVILPSPAETWRALVELVRSGAVVRELGRTLWRSLSGVVIALTVGVAWGGLAGWSRWIWAVTRPLAASLMAFPPVILVAIGLVWFGPGPTVTRLVVVAVALPLVVVAVEEAVTNLDRDLLEMARAFALRRSAIVRHVVLPGIASPVTAVVAVTVGQAIRVAVMAELLAASDGIGAEISLARTNLATADLFAWAVVMVATVLVAELVLLRPFSQRISRWRRMPQSDYRSISSGRMRFTNSSTRPCPSVGHPHTR